MRSRDGNKTFSLSIPISILFLSLALNAGEYLISYRYLIKDSILYNETLNISQAMKKCSGKVYNPLILEVNKEKNLKEIISQNREQFIYYLHKLGLNLVHKDKTVNYIQNSITILTLHTKCFKVDFNDNFVKISPLK